MTDVLAGGTGLTAPAETFQTVVFGSASAVRRHTALLQPVANQISNFSEILLAPRRTAAGRTG